MAQARCFGLPAVAARPRIGYFQKEYLAGRLNHCGNAPFTLANLDVRCIDSHAWIAIWMSGFVRDGLGATDEHYEINSEQKVADREH
jgi:hypothetical protein